MLSSLAFKLAGWGKEVRSPHESAVKEGTCVNVAAVAYSKQSFVFILLSEQLCAARWTKLNLRAGTESC